MPALLSLFLAVLATIGFFGGLYFVVLTALEARRTVARPRLGMAPGAKPGSLTVWADWDADAFAIQVYRFRLKFYNPYGEPKEPAMTVTFDPPQKAPFAQEIELPEDFKRIIEAGSINKNALLTVDFRTVDETTLPVNFLLGKVRKIYHGQTGKLPSRIKTRLPSVVADPPPVASLDFAELSARKKKLRDLEAAAKAKAAKAPPAKPVAATAAAPAPAPAAAPAVAAPTKTSDPAEGKPLPSIKSVIAQMKETPEKG